MKNFIIALWLILAAFIVVPIGVDYASGEPESEAMQTIERESEAENVRITAVEKHGNKAMYAFTAGDDFGVAIFSSFADNYKYTEGTISNGQDHIDVYLNTGWDVYRYEVTEKGARQTGFEKFGGVYRIYAAAAAVMAAVSIAAAIYSNRRRKQRKNA